jgi:hypothetical protein
MTTHKRYEELIQECWDQKRDPVDDSRVQDYLLDHPDHLESFAKWRAGVAAVEHVLPQRRRLWALAVALIVLPLTLYVSLRAPGATKATPVVPPIATNGGFVHSSFTQETIGSGHVVRWRERRILVDTQDTFLAIIEHRSAQR